MSKMKTKSVALSHTGERIVENGIKVVHDGSNGKAKRT
jgi:hypothetical protein